MSLLIEVYRDAGDRTGDPIHEPLLGESLSAALARGRAELDAHAHARVTTTMELVAPRLDLLPGALVEVSDPAQGASWRGLITAVAHSMAQGAAPTTLTLESIADG